MCLETNHPHSEKILRRLRGFELLETQLFFFNVKTGVHNSSNSKQKGVHLVFQGSRVTHSKTVSPESMLCQVTEQVRRGSNMSHSPQRYNLWNIDSVPGTIISIFA